MLQRYAREQEAHAREQEARAQKAEAQLAKFVREQEARARKAQEQLEKSTRELHKLKQRDSNIAGGSGSHKSQELPPIGKMSIEALQQECKVRGLQHTGSFAVLRMRVRVARKKPDMTRA